MTQVQTELLEKRQAKITVEVDNATRDKEMKSAARRIAKKVRIPGFRPGKAPYNVIRQYYGEAAILEEALESIVQEAYTKALEDAEFEPYAPGNLENVEFDPMVLTFTVPLTPTVDLNDYRSVRVDYSIDELEEQEIDDALEDLRERQAEMDEVDRELALGDVAEMDIIGRFTDADEAEEPWLKRENVRIMIKEDATYPLPGFPQEVIGMKADEERSFEIATPDEDEELPEELHGKTVAFEVKCLTVMDFKVPELTDEFAQSVGEFETVEDLRKELTEVRKNQLEQQAREEYLEKIFEELDDIVEMEYPDAMVEHEVELRIEDFDRQLQQSGLKLDDYKTMNKIDDEKLIEDFKPEAERRLRRGLILSTLVEEEKLSVTDDDVEDEIATLTLSYGTEAALARQFFSGDEAKRSIRNQLMTDKALDRLMAIAKGEAPDIDVVEEAAQAASDEIAEGEVVQTDDVADTKVEAVEEVEIAPVVAPTDDDSVEEETEKSE